MKNFKIVASGHACTELVVETNHLRKYLEESGLTEISEKKEADVILVSTCSFNQEFEDEAYKNIQDVILSKKPGAKIMVSGCFPSIAPAKFNSFKDITSIPPLNMEKIEEIIPSKISMKDVLPNTVNLNDYLLDEKFIRAIKLKNLFSKIKILGMPRYLDSLPMTDWYFIQGGNGCMGDCSYCAIRHARGKIQSMPMDRIIPQMEKAVRRGYKTISFSGTDMGCWGQDIGQNLADLLNEVVKVKGDFVVDMHYVEANWLYKYLPKLEHAFNTGKIRSFGVPVQSGSNKILKLMNRHYTIEEYLEAVNYTLTKTKIRSINSIMMLGFPGETLDDYMESYHLINKLKISYWCFLKYEGRFNIKSESFEGKVSEDIKINRRDRLNYKTTLTNYLKIPNQVSEKMTFIKFGEFK